jgi:hypothetical protein
MASNRLTTAQLRRDIDEGRTGSKTDYPDPAAAPLGTDDEAAGAPPPAAAVAAAQRLEVQDAQARTAHGGTDSGTHIYAGIIAVIIAILSAVALYYAS